MNRKRQPPRRRALRISEPRSGGSCASCKSSLYVWQDDIRDSVNPSMPHKFIYREPVFFQALLQCRDCKVHADGTSELEHIGNRLRGGIHANSRIFQLMLLYPVLKRRPPYTDDTNRELHRRFTCCRPHRNPQFMRHCLREVVKSKSAFQSHDKIRSTQREDFCFEQRRQGYSGRCIYAAGKSLKSTRIRKRLEPSTGNANPLRIGD